MECFLQVDVAVLLFTYFSIRFVTVTREVTLVIALRLLISIDLYKIFWLIVLG